jgi:hypothetical protein
VSLSSFCDKICSQISCSFLYTVFLMANVNFKLKGKDHGISNPELALEWALFVEEGHY